MEKIFKYKTKQRARILEYLKNNSKQHITADEIINYFKKTENPIGKSTIYRCIDNLIEENVIRKYINEEGKSACFQYIDNQEDCANHYHMKCIKCGNLLHLDCHEINSIQEHILKNHNFKIDVCKTILYGNCDKCMNNK